MELGCGVVFEVKIGRRRSRSPENFCLHVMFAWHFLPPFFFYPNEITIRAAELREATCRPCPLYCTVGETKSPQQGEITPRCGVGGAPPVVISRRGNDEVTKSRSHCISKVENAQQHCSDSRY